MPNKKLFYGFLLFLFVLALIGAWLVFSNLRQPELKVIFLDVGQGDAILIEQGKYQMLIDGGKDGKLLLEKMGKYMPFWDRNIETVVETHPDQDHIGGLVDVLKNYQVSTVIKTDDISESQTFAALEKEIRAEGTELIEAVAGVKINFPDGAKAEVLYPFGEVVPSSTDNSNKDSVVLKFRWKEETFLFSGDLPSEGEQQLIDQGIDLKSDVLKAAHHGSKYSTTDAFLDRVQPGFAVISVGAHNMYGHPSAETLERLKNHNVQILRTDERGDIVFECKAQSEKCQLFE